MQLQGKCDGGMSALKKSVLAIAGAMMLTACQVTPQTGFSAAQKAVLTESGFVETADGWALTMADRMLFEVDESRLQPAQIATLSSLAERLAKVGIVSARVEGHSDATGSAEHNLRLSQARAEAVAGPLRSNGMQFDPAAVIGRGEALPVGDNSTAEGRADNRRVVIIVTP